MARRHSPAVVRIRASDPAPAKNVAPACAVTLTTIAPATTDTPMAPIEIRAMAAGGVMLQPPSGRGPAAPRAAPVR